MAAMRIEEIYERYLKPLSPSEQLRLVSLLTQGAAHGAREDIRDEKLDITGLHGLGKEIWQGVDAQEYVNKLRAEWDHRP